jgi:hypothetical protein
VPGVNPAVTALSTKNVLSELTAANVKPNPIASRTRGLPRALARSDRCLGGGSAEPRGTDASTTSDRTATAANAQRQPTVRATRGTASPASSVAAGGPDCLTPNAKPSRPGSTDCVRRTSQVG